MKVTHVSIVPAEAAKKAVRPELSPELLAAVGARYSRNPEGLDGLYEKACEAVGLQGEVAAVDSIFKFVDYGHQSIADMVPIPIFMDGLSLWLIYHIFSLTPTGSGQETSTRYVRFNREGMLDPARFLPQSEDGYMMDQEFGEFTDECFKHYQRASEIWESISKADPNVMKIPGALLNNALEGDQKALLQVERMRRNYVFDRARYFIPVAATNNMMLIMSARGWVQLVQQLYNYPVGESQMLANCIVDELKLVAPHMVRHATPKLDVSRRVEKDLTCLRNTAADMWRLSNRVHGTAQVRQGLKTYLEQENRRDDAELHVGSLQGRENRYSPFGRTIRNCGVRFTIDGLSFAETRDLNRHRTGNKDAILAPQGFYWAMDQIPPNYNAEALELQNMAEATARRVERASQLLENGYKGYMYFLPLGFQHRFSHLTTADKFLYEMELRTGVGAHFRYAQHMRGWLNLWYKAFPQTQGLVLEGTAEPE